MIRRHYEHAPELNVFAKGYRKLLAHYYNPPIPRDASVLEIGCGAGELLSLLQTRAICGIDIAEGQINKARTAASLRTLFCAGRRGSFPNRKVRCPSSFRIRSIFRRMCSSCFSGYTIFRRQRRGFSLTFIRNSGVQCWKLASRPGLRSQQPPANWLSPSDVSGLLYLADWEPIKRQSRIFYPALTPLLNQGLNRWLAPLLPFLCLSIFVTARSKPLAGSRRKCLRLVF